MPKSRSTGIVVAGIGVLLLVASLREVVAEAAPYIAGGISSDQRFLSLESGRFEPANSLWSKNLFFLDCINAATDPFVLLERTEQSRRKALTFCLDQASKVLAAEPSYAMAWMAKAVAAAELGMTETFNASLAEARRTAPYLDWMAQQRIALVERHPDTTSTPSAMDVYRSDVRSLLNSAPGVDYVADLYVEHPERRDLITDVAETATTEQQATFLSLVKRKMSTAK